MYEQRLTEGAEALEEAERDAEARAGELEARLSRPAAARRRR